jgi:hypothetical protein
VEEFERFFLEPPKKMLEGLGVLGTGARRRGIFSLVHPSAETSCDSQPFSITIAVSTYGASTTKMAKFHSE